MRQVLKPSPFYRRETEAHSAEVIPSLEDSMSWDFGLIPGIGSLIQVSQGPSF